MDKVAGPNTIGMDPSIFQRGALGQPRHQKKRLKKRSLINRKEMQVLEMTAQPELDSKGERLPTMVSTENGPSPQDTARI